MKYTKLQHNYSHHHHQGGATSTNGSRSASLASSTSSKRMKKHNWGTRERTGMSFLIVIAFFAVFGVIILTEIFMIDDRGHSGMMVRGGGGGYGNRLGDSMPDYDNVKDDYDLIDASLLSDNKFGFVQFQDNKYKIQDAYSNDGGGGGGGGSNGRLAGVLINSNSVSGGNSYAGGVASASAVGGNAPLIPWGKMLPNKVEESLPHYPFGITPTDGTWQIVNGTRFKFFVFSAYYDRRDGGKLIRVVGATKTRGPERVWCRLWYAPVNQNISSPSNNREQSHKSVTVIARVKVIRENWNLKYSACFVLCPVRSSDYDVPQHISIVSRLRAPPSNLLLLRNTDWDLDFQQKNPNNSSQSMMKFPRDDQIPDKLAVCVKPFHFDYDQALYLMEYLEFYALMGVSHFTFYNHTIGPQADCVLQHYIKGDVPDKSTSSDLAMEIVPRDKDSPALTPSGSTPPVRVLKSYNYTKPTVQMLPWNLRMRSQKEIRTEGLFAALNDCLYRTMYRYKYLALVDLDEFIVPRHNDTLRELINSLNSRFRNRNTGAYSFQNAFFYLQFGDDPLVAQWEENEPMELAKLRAALVTQRKTRRRFKLHPQKQRSKYICKPEAVVEAGNHFVWEFLPGKGSLNVPPTDAILQHYRVCEFGGNDCIKAPSILDRTATKYVNRLMERVYKVYKHLKQKCKLPELPPLPKIMPPRSEMKPIIRQTEKKSSKQKKMNNNNNENSNNSEKKTRENPLKATTALQLNEMKMNLIQEKTVHELKTNKTTITNNITSTIFMTSTTTTTTTTTPAITTTMNTTKKENIRSVAANKRKRKVVVFFVDDQGQPRARLEYH